MSLTEPPPLQARSPIERWALDPHVSHLNHGSYGGCPRAVVEAAAAFRTRLEANPMRFLVLEWQAELDRARAALAAFVAAPVHRLAFQPNATTGVATALHSFALTTDLAPGDELIAIDHGYRACTNQLARLAAARGLRVVTVAVPVPFEPDALAEALAAAITPRTRLALLDHVTSPTAFVLPIARLLPVFAARGIAVIVDGAHAPGQLDLDVGALLAAGATYYAGNCHKWMCAPKGSGFLVVAEGAPAIPVVTSHGASPDYGGANRLHAELDWAGTHDPSAHLAVPTAIDAVAREGGGWANVRARNHAVVVEMRERLSRGLGEVGRGRPLAPADSLGAMAAVPIALPPGVAPGALERELLADGWEIPIVNFAAGPLVRISAHLYNEASEADELAHELHRRGVRIA